MKRFCHVWAAGLALAAVCAAVAPSLAADAIAINNATVQPTGPRPGSSGKAFLNVEGRDVPMSDMFASYGVLDFDASDLGLGTVTEVNSVTVTLQQSLASFTSRGRMRFFVTEDNTTDIEPGTSPLFFDNTDVYGLANQLQPIYALSTGEFSPVRSSWIETYTFNIASGSALETYLKNQINAGNIIRVVVCPENSEIDAELVTGTYGGYTNTLGYVPKLSVTAQ
jgi:hypothetical protein